MRTINRIMKKITVFLAISFFLLSFSQNAYCKPRKKEKAKSDNMIVKFLKENGVDIKKKIVAIQVTGQEQTADGPIAVMKLIAINPEPPKGANKDTIEFIKGANKLSADVIETIVVSIADGTVITNGDTAKVADLQIFFEDGSSFNVMVGENFSQIIFEKILRAPENPFSKEPIEKTSKILSFISPNLLKSVKIILKPKGD